VLPIHIIWKEAAYRCALPAGGRDEITPLCRNQLQAKQTACLHRAAGTGENAQSPTTMAPAFFAGDRVHAVLGGS